MHVQLNCVIVDADEANRREMASFLSTFGLSIAAQLPNSDQLADLLNRSDAPQVVIVNLDPGAMDNLHKIGHLPRQFHNVSFFVLSQVLDPNLLMEAMHLGVKEFVPLPINEQKFTAALERLASVHGMGKRAKIINVIPTIGGCGATTIACNLAASLAQSRRTALLDMDLVRGGVGGYFDMKPRYTIADVMQSAERVDRQLLDNALAVHQRTNVAILARPDLLEDTQRVNQPGLVRLLNIISRMFDAVVIDSTMSVDPMYATTLQSADTNVIIMQLNVPSAKNAERFVATLRRMGVESSKIKIVVNRFVKKGWDIDPVEVERALGLKISWLIPNDFKTAIAAINYGEPFVISTPRAEISQCISEFGQMLMGKVVSQAA
ncbi:MAG: transcriptional regulator [Phycisphaerae bacterium]|jgi:pilus assembly protein CpaE|nr:MAG: transcriptional regulator [Phycisphaerae bacterium]